MTHTIEKVKLVEVRRKAADGRPAVYYVLRWTSRDGRLQQQSIGRTAKSGGDVTRAMATEARRRKEQAIASGAEPRNRPRRIGLGQFLERYQERRRRGDVGRGYLRGSPRLNERTITEHAMTLRYLIQHFGAARSLDSIDQAGAESWVIALKSGKLSDARKESRQRYSLGEQRLRHHIRNAKAVYNWAVRFGFASRNPFADFDGGALPSKENPYVAIAELEKLLGAAPAAGWRALYGLCRFAGLRRGEALELPWSGMAKDSRGDEHRVGIDWARRVIGLVGNEKRSRSFREVPICPRLYELLLAAFDQAEPGDVAVVDVPKHNLTKRAREHARAAGLTPWPKFYQSMRSSCENDWKAAGIAEPTYCRWIGHSTTTSRKHYVAPLATELAMITGATPVG